MMPTKEDYLKFFQEADTDGSGSLSLDELVAILKSKGYKKTDAELKSMFDHIDTSGDGLISLSEYLEAMGQQPPAVHGIAAMRSAFLAFDKNGDGRIDRSEMKQVFTEMKRSFTDEEIERIMEQYDDDKSGDLNYEEFMRHVFKVQI